MAQPSPTAAPPEWLSSIDTADALFAADLDRRIAAWSPSAERFFGLAAAEAIGRPCHEVVGSLDAVACGSGCRPVLEARRGRTIAHPDFVGRDAHGRSLHLRATVLRTTQSGAQPPLLVHLVRPCAAAGATHEDVPPLVSPLSPRETEVLRLLAAGRSTREIAESFTISPVTARNHVLNVERKLGAHSRVAAIHLARLHGLL